MKSEYFLIFDFDSTVIQLESLEEIAGFALQDKDNKDEILKEIGIITDLGMEGKIDFKESLKKRLALFNIHQNHIDLSNQKILQNITLFFLKNIEFIRENAEKIYIISGGFFSNILPVAKRLGISPSHIMSNKFIFDSQNNVCGIDESSPLLLPQGKSQAVSSLKLDGKIIIIGDGYTDYQIKENGACKYFISFCENVRRENVIKKSDFSADNLDEAIRIISKL
ncbi:MAG: hypothetical protein ACD_15C00195G0007 [uncultured bacterium]|nr:MAG: hypothetical protein ACD_15C00195G0007 [uncultured bacterium]HCU70501.1 hypothetical protein [Candidatus Moranbacteria bacterium]